MDLASDKYLFHKCIGSAGWHAAIERIATGIISRHVVGYVRRDNDFKFQFHRCRYKSSHVDDSCGIALSRVLRRCSRTKHLYATAIDANARHKFPTADPAIDDH